jgi:hypothetical protein
MPFRGNHIETGRKCAVLSDDGSTLIVAEVISGFVNPFVIGV